ncbi:tetratricopeptide repeat protein [Pontimicrobium sp. IMCC45349]|uniref:tetratricopeptide repeat protein n=1 Tax=Pontimicrobium sp. IMCC45349 TaxID=3391574 RepID=UPI0039A02361
MLKKYLPLFIILFIYSCKQNTSPETIVLESPRTSKYACVPQITDAEWYKKDNIAPLLEGLDVVNYKITTKDTLVQKYFNQGMTLAYGFNHAEAARSFYYATKLDPNCAMAFWGYAYVLGPNYNAGMEPDNYQRAYEAIQTAKELSENSTQKEKELIETMAIRYAQEPPEDRYQLDIDYSTAMKTLYNTYPDDSEISVLYAESIMNLHPWDLYNKEGDAKEWTPEIVLLLESNLEKYPNHPGAHHFYIHAVEASNTPERANNSAKMFDDGLVSGSGHLLHMPSHIYIRTGEYHKGTLSNIAAVKADSTYVTQCHAQGAYPLGYYPHNYHFMAATATLEGNSHWAMIGANKVSEHVHPKIMKQPGWGTLQHYYITPYNVAVKFKKWDDILAMKFETYDLNYIKAIRHYAEGMAHLGKGDQEKAKLELQQLLKLSKEESLKEVTIWDINTVYDLVSIAAKVLEAEIWASEGEFDTSIILLKEAVAIEDALNYNEPPDWFFSIRHHLGNIQLKAKHYENAIKTFKDDLKRLPKNGWAHHGLKQAYEKLGNTEKAKHYEDLIKTSWIDADYIIE